jgi:tetratricopeptide (TPR) repeat protein
VTLLPGTDDRVETHVVVDDPATGPDAKRAIHFQEWWVRHRAELPAHRFVPVGADEATIALASLRLLEVQSSSLSLELTTVIDRAEQLADQLERLGDTRGALDARSLVAGNLFFSGRAAEAAQRLLPLVQGAEELGTAISPWLGAALYWGPTPVPEATARVEELIHSVSRKGLYKRHLGSLTALAGRFDEARRLLAEAKQEFEELGLRFAAFSVSGHYLGPVEMLAGNYQLAAEIMETSYNEMTATGDRSFASTVAGWLAMALLGLGRYDDAWKYATIACETSSAADVASQAPGRSVQARVLAERGDVAASVSLAEEAVAIAKATDYLHTIGAVLVDQALVLRAAGRTDDALAAARDGLDHYQRKGVIPSIERTKRLIAEWETG